MPEPEVRYDWPEGGGAPFDTTPDETRWVLVAGSRFGRTWPETGEERHGTYEVLDGGGSRRLPDGSWERHEHHSYAAALAEAEGMRERRVLVARLVETRDWH